MLTEKEYRLATRWFGEFLREASVLILVFVPLDWYLGKHDDRGWITVTAFFVALLLLAGGIQIGIMAEKGGAENV